MELGERKADNHQMKNEPLRIMSVVGARPNFMKIAPLVHAIKERNALCADGDKPLLQHILIHTGQHYDERMSTSFFDDLGIPRPDINLGIGSGTHAEQVGHTMIAFERVVREQRPDWVVVLGDVNATCACSLTAKKEGINVAHIEAGLRSRDMSMPEEINRLVTDRLSDLLFTTDAIACENLRREGVAEERIKLVGNIMIDTLFTHQQRAMELSIGGIIERNLCNGTSYAVPRDETFALLTMHRPSNVDSPDILGPIVEFLCNGVAADMPIIWPIHPRSLKNLQSFGLWDKVAASNNMILLHPVGYTEMVRLNMGARVLFTDSGGLQEESCVLGTPCVTLRWNTERPVTLCEHGGVSQLAGNDLSSIRKIYDELKHRPKIPHSPPLWDGRTAKRITDSFAAMAGSAEIA
jgi:UDP-N-acetylglucosamine 2-epimerase (non-hydrolysing)